MLAKCPSEINISDHEVTEIAKAVASVKAKDRDDFVMEWQLLDEVDRLS